MTSTKNILQEGDKAPDFTLKNEKEQEVSLNSFKGKWVVLYFYPKDNTSGCTKEAQDFSTLRGDFEKRGARIIGISPDGTASHKAFIEKHHLGVDHLLSDPDKKVLLAYGAWGMKKNYGKEYQGVIRSTFIISPEGTVRALWRNLKVRSKRKSGEVTHASIVLEKLEKILDE